VFFRLVAELRKLPAEECRLQKEKVRVYVLARELNVPTKDLLDLCTQAGLDVKNQLQALDPEQRDLIEQLLKRRQGAAAAAAPPSRSATGVLPPPTRTIRVLDTPRRAATELSRVTTVPATLPSPEITRTVETVPPTAPPAPAAELPAAAAAKSAVTPTATAPPTPTPAAERAPVPAGGEPPQPTEPASQPGAPADAGATRTRQIPYQVVRRIPNLNRPRDEASAKPRVQPPLKQTGAPFAPTTSPKPGLAARTKKTGEQALKPIARLTQEMLDRKQPITPDMLLRPKTTPGQIEGLAPGDVEGDEEDSQKKKAGGKPRPGGVGDRNQRRQAREARANERKRAGGVAVVEGKIVEEEEVTRIRRENRRRLGVRVAPAQPRKGGKVTVEPPVTVRVLSEAFGLKSVELVFKLKNHGLTNPSINTVLTPQVAEELALEAGFELEIRRPPDAEDRLLAAASKPDNPEDLVSRAPIVTVMGHVDHGKTSLLDRIRQSNIAATEKGGITQVLRAWRVEHDGKAITFLDTPGHEAFTKMRARGAQVTDIAVIVVAADDGVMPQTEEAINHARAANVSLVVAINKVDLPSANVNKTRQQLYGLGVLPDNMGGDTPFVETSAATGKGIDELLEAISLVAELKELRANPNKSGRGTCLEAMLSEGEGVRATLLVQDGTLRRGDVISCGPAFGRVRQLYDDLGRPIEEAGPSVPVRITGLDEVPNADDRFFVVDELTTAREVAEKRKDRQQEAQAVKRTPFSLETLTQAAVAELKVILKADFRGSVEAIRKELEKLQHAEVRVRILHTGIGAITESDVQLALTSPEDTIIVGFNVVPDDRAMALAEEKGVPIRQYNIIYELTKDIRAALEGKLKPRQEVVHLGRAVVRQTFKISRVGTIAGCYVTQGVIRRQGKVRVIRGGVVIYPPPDRSAGLDSLKRFKEDAAEVREGFECGLKIAGYDDVKVDDVIECYRVEEVQRTLEK
jgi:translation initiation factor IF-2